MRSTDAARRAEIARKAALGRHTKKEATMIEHENACDAVAAIYKQKAAAGLIDVKFFVDDAYKATREVVCGEVLRLELAIAEGDFEPLVFNDRH